MSDEIRPIGKENHSLNFVPKIEGAKVRDDKLNCPHCLTVNGKIVPDHVPTEYSTKTKQVYEGEATPSQFGITHCENCNSYTIWKQREGVLSPLNQNEVANKKNIPEEIQKTFNDAISIKEKQPDKAAKLLLYSIKALNVHICGSEKCNFENMITNFEHSIPVHEHDRLLNPIRDMLSNIVFHQDPSADKHKLLNSLISLFNFMVLLENPDKKRPKKKIDV